MAVVGQLLVELSANVARLRTDMERASGVVEQHTRKMAQAASFATGALGALGAGLSVGALTQSFMSAANSMDALNDAADRTGASIGELSSLVNTLAPYGHNLDTISTASERLVKAMSAADDEAKGAGEAFKLLGVETRDASGNLRPTADVLQEVADAMSQYGDGSNKTALAIALFGKQGAALLPMLKDLAQAKRADATVSEEMAAAAEKFNIQLGTMMRGLDAMKVALVGPVISALSGVVERFNAAGNSAENFYNRLRLALQPTSEIERLTGNVARLESELQGLQSLKVLPEFETDRLAQITTVTKRLAQARKELTDAAPVQAIVQRDSLSMRALEDRGFTPAAPAAPRLTGGSTQAAQQRATQTEAERLLATLTEQLAKTQDLTTEQQVLGRIGRGEIDGMNAALEQQILLVATRIDKAKEQAEIISRATADEAADIQAINRLTDEARRSTEREIETIRNAVDPTRALYKEIERVQQLMSAGLIGEEGNARLMMLFSQIDGILQKLPEKADEAASGMKDMLAPIESAFESAIIRGEKLSSVLSSLAQDFARMMLRQQITGPLQQILSGTFDAAKGGGTLVGGLVKILGFADGGQMRAGYPALVGERGPEIITPRHSGYVVPNGKSMSGGGTIVQNFDMRNSALTPAVIEMAAKRGAALGQAQARDARARGSEAFA